MEIRKRIFLLMVLLFSAPAFCNEELTGEEFSEKEFNTEALIETFRLSLEKNPDVQKIQNDFRSLKIYKKQYDYQWFPALQFDFPQSTTFSRGDRYAVINQNSSPRHTLMLNPGIRFSIQQKLPGNGAFSVSSGYQFYYLPDRKKFLQLPFFSTNFSQTISTDSFMFSKNSEAQLLKTQMDYNLMELNKNLFEQLKLFINLLAEYDTLNAQSDYYNSQLDFYSAKTISAEEKYKNGLQSNLELYYARHSLQNNKQQLKTTEFNKKELQQQIHQLYGSFDFSILDEYRDLFMELFSSQKNEFVSDQKLYENILLQNQLVYTHNELSFKPQIYFSSQINPDTSFYYKYSDWKKSWRSLIDSPVPININTTLGFLINLELPKAKKMRKEIYEFEQENVRNKMLAAIELQKKTYEDNALAITNLTEYFYSLKEEFVSENSFRSARREMLENQLLTQEDFLESEITYFTIRMDYINTFWTIIKKQLEVIEISSGFDEYINLFFYIEG